jgi:hypothetical protein
MHLPIRTLIILLALLVSAFIALPASADYRSEKTYTLAPEGVLAVEVAVGSVSVTGHDGSGATVVITSKRDDLDAYLDFAVDEAPGRLTLTAKRKGSRVSSWWGRGLHVHYEIQVPRETTLEVSTAGGAIQVQDLRGGVVRTSGGAIRGTDLLGDFEARTSGGSIRISDVGGTLIARTSGGSIQIERVAGEVDASTSGGGIRIAEVGGRLRAHTSGGSISVAFLPGPFKGAEVSTSGGSIRIAVDPAADLKVDASCAGGSISTDLPITVTGKLAKSRITGTVGAGGEVLRARTSGGSIRIETL